MKKLKKRYAIYYLRHLRFNLLRKIVSEDINDNKKTLKRLIDEIVRIMTIYSDYYNFRVQGKNNMLKKLKQIINDEKIITILTEAIKIRNRWTDIKKVEEKEILYWIKNLNYLEYFILKDNMYSSPEELMNN